MDITIATTQVPTTRAGHSWLLSVSRYERRTVTLWRKEGLDREEQHTEFKVSGLHPPAGGVGGRSPATAKFGRAASAWGDGARRRDGPAWTKGPAGEGRRRPIHDPLPSPGHAHRHLERQHGPRRHGEEHEVPAEGVWAPSWGEGTSPASRQTTSRKPGGPESYEVRPGQRRDISGITRVSKPGCESTPARTRLPRSRWHGRGRGVESKGLMTDRGPEKRAWAGGFL